MEAGGGGQVATAALLGMGADDVPEAARALAHHPIASLSPYRPARPPRVAAAATPDGGGSEAAAPPPETGDEAGGATAPEPWSAYLGVHIVASRPWPDEE